MILLPVFATVLLLCMWSAVLYQVAQERAGARHEAVLHSQALARTLAENASHVLRQADHATQLFKLKFEETDGALRLPEFTRKNGLLDSLMPSRLELPIALIGADGLLIDSQHGDFARDVAGEQFFKALTLSGDDMAHSSNPLLDTMTKKWTSQLARRLNDRNGNFAGAILIRIDPAYFVEDYDRLHVEDKGLVMLVSRDTGLAIGRVDEHLIISDTVDYVTTIDSTGSAEELVPSRPIDGIARIYSYRDMPRYALTAVVGNTTTSALAKFRRQRSMYYCAAGAASVLVIAFSALLLQQRQSLRRSVRTANAARQTLRAAADASLDAVFLLKACRSRSRGGDIVDFTLADVNERGARMLGHPREEVLGQRIGELVPSWRDGGFIDKYKQVLESGQPLEEEFETHKLTGLPLWLRHQIVAIDDGVAVTTRNITPRKQAELDMRRQQAELAESEMALRESEARLRTIADTLPAMVAYIDHDEIYRFNNRAYEREFIRAGIDVMGMTVRATVGEQRYQVLQPYIRRALDGETLTFEEEDNSKDISRSYEVDYIPQFDEAGAKVIGLHVMRQDITAQKREKQHLLKLSQVDALTGLTNRAGFLQKLSASMAACRDTGGTMAVMYMDIDRFKPVNDTYGHSVGDALLKSFSARLTHTMRASDTIARLGGDEFTIIVERVNRPEDAAALAGKIVTAMQAPFDLEGITVSVSASIGLTFYRDEDISPAEVLKRADVLLYQAKQAGRNTYRSGQAEPDAA